MSTYTVNITMSATTVSDLAASGNYLYQLGVVQTSDQMAKPIMMMQTVQYSMNTPVTWTDTLGGFTAFGPVTVGKPLIPGFATPMQLGQLLSVTNQGLGTVSSNGVGQAIAIQNTTTNPFVCGIEEGASSTPICVVPLYGNGFQIIQPLSATFLMFSNVQQPAGMVIAYSTAQGMLINMSGSPTQSVSFDINQGWSNNGQPWGTVYPANTNLCPILTGYSTSLAAEAAKLALRAT